MTLQILRVTPGVVWRIHAIFLLSVPAYAFAYAFWILPATDSPFGTFIPWVSYVALTVAFLFIPLGVVAPLLVRPMLMRQAAKRQATKQQAPTPLELHMACVLIGDGCFHNFALVGLAAVDAANMPSWIGYSLLGLAFLAMSVNTIRVAQMPEE